MKQNFIEVKYRVIYGDTDCGGVVYYANYLRFFEMGRNEFIRSLGFTYREIEEKFGIFLPVIESHVIYRGFAQYDDQILIKTWISELSKYKVKFECEIFKAENLKLLVKGYTVHVPVKDGKIVKFPEEVYSRLKETLNNH